MTLWTKPISQITFPDVEDFCASGLPEGTNLDYKSDIPAELEKIVSSFANTSGGLLLLGVRTNAQNRPETIVGLNNTRGFSERITQICRDRIHPAILPEISSLIELPHDATKGVAVIRVQQSHEAPHAINNKTKVYVRRGDVSDVIDLADIDRIESLLNRRKLLASSGHAFIERNLSRMRRLINPLFEQNPVVWWSVTPLYPWQNICDPEQCRDTHFGVLLHRGPNGAFGFDTTRNRRTTLVSIDAHGFVFRGQVLIPHHPDEVYLLALPHLVGLAEDFFSHVRSFYGTAAMQHPGQLTLSIGFQNVQSQIMIGPTGAPDSQFPDNEFQATETVAYHSFMTLPTEGLSAESRRLHNAIAHAFDLPPMF